VEAVVVKQLGVTRPRLRSPDLQMARHGQCSHGLARVVGGAATDSDDHYDVAIAL